MAVKIELRTIRVTERAENIIIDALATKINSIMSVNSSEIREVFTSRLNLFFISENGITPKNLSNQEIISELSAVIEGIMAYDGYQD